MSAQAKRAEKASAYINGLYCITAEPLSNGRDNIQVVRDMLAGGAQVIQYREKDMPMLKQYEQCQVLRKMTQEAGALFVIDDHVHLALAVGADCIHIGQTDLPIEAVRRLVGEQMLIGLSTHNIDQARGAVARGADYIGVGPIFETHTKADVTAPVGYAYLDQVVKEIPLPFVAIGGIKKHNLADVMAHGAACAALVTEIVQAPDIAGTVHDLRTIFSDSQKPEETK